MPTYQQHVQAMQRARAAGDTEAVEFIRKQAIAADQAETKARADAEERSRPLAQRLMTNLGAGLDSAWQGAKQLVGQGEGDEALAEKRAIDEQLAGQTTGGGLTQIAGELLPTVAAGGGVGVAARALPAAVRAGRGMQALGSTLSKAPVRGAVEGAGAAALMPTMSDESRLQNMALGGAGGAAAPYVLKGAAKAARKTGQGVQRLVAGTEVLPGAKAAARAGGTRRAAELLQREGIDQSTVATPVYVPHPNLGTTPSAAVTAQNPKLASLELGSRNAVRDEWLPFDQAQQSARWQHLDQNLQKGGDVDRLLDEANQIGAKVPYEAAGPRLFKRQMDDFFDSLQVAKQTPQYHGKPAVRAAVDYIEDTMRKAGTVTPELVHQMKQTLQKGLTGAPGAGEAGVRAAASEPFVISLTQALDDVLAQSSKGGKWGKWKQQYGSKMTEAEAAKADVNIRNKFVDEATGTLKKTQVGPMQPGEPVVTGHALKQAVAQAGSAKRGPRKGQELLSKQSKGALRNVEQDLDAQNILQNLKAASTGGSGSDTASNLMSAAGLGLIDPATGITKFLYTHGGNRQQQEMQRQLAALLQDPAKLRAFLQAQELRRASQAKLPYAPGLGAAVTLPAMD